MSTDKLRYDVCKTVEELDKMIANAGDHYSKARRVAQVAAVNVLIHAAKHGDYSRAEKLVSVVADDAALVKWFTVYGGLIVDEENGGFNGWKGKEHIKAQLENAKATMFWTFKAPNPYKGFNLQEQYDKLIKKAEGALEKRNKFLAEGDTESADKVEVNEELLIALKGVNPEAVSIQ